MQVFQPKYHGATRQNLPAVRSDSANNKCERGGYIIRKEIGSLDATILATGSEVHIALEATKALQEQGISSRVVSIPCLDIFLEQPSIYIEEVIGHNVPIVAVEAGIRQGWDGLIGKDGGFIGMSGYGASGPGAQLFKHFGITSDAIVTKIKRMCAR